MKNVYVVTHPEATHHVDGIVGGWFDSDLTDRGARHAQAIAEALSTQLTGSAVEVYSSDLLRARRTAEVIVQRLGAGLTIDPDLREKSYGKAEGMPQSWLDERFIPPPRFGERMRHNEGVDGAETRMDLAERAYGAMTRIQESTTQNQIVVTHGGTATFLIAAWIGMPIDAADRVHFRVSSGGISVLRKDDRLHSHQLAQLNDISHLT
ncbi:histidine phosphatase family protein [Phytoactinopolyspora endophytica]|uniref:histidine phosphatase family protein n=1 Tax=Phytoactinopolyspora endophytica TaxID=1642495 RepID=UPI00101CA0B2|nr:histidine phosphatase family protein [Phytoactinopolyspora endophytica]